MCYCFESYGFSGGKGIGWKGIHLPLRLLCFVIVVCSSLMFPFLFALFYHHKQFVRKQIELCPASLQGFISPASSIRRIPFVNNNPLPNYSFVIIVTVSASVEYVVGAFENIFIWVLAAFLSVICAEACPLCEWEVSLVYTMNTRQIRIT